MAIGDCAVGQESGCAAALNPAQGLSFMFVPDVATGVLVDSGAGRRSLSSRPAVAVRPGFPRFHRPGGIF